MLIEKLGKIEKFIKSTKKKNTLLFYFCVFTADLKPNWRWFLPNVVVYNNKSFEVFPKNFFFDITFKPTVLVPVFISTRNVWLLFLCIPGVWMRAYAFFFFVFVYFSWQHTNWSETHFICVDGTGWLMDGWMDGCVVDYTDNGQHFQPNRTKKRPDIFMRTSFFSCSFSLEFF